MLKAVLSLSLNSLLSSRNGTPKVATGDPEDAHLFVLVHGLWGSPNHMLTIETAIRDTLTDVGSEKIVTLKPSSFRFWKTYDGIQRCAERVVADLLYEIETLKKNDHCKVVKISIIGYSLGGLISRYVIGVLEEMGFFTEVQPVFFCTFATPHVGVRFFRQNVFDRSANFLGQYIFGKTGGELFVTDSNKLLVTMADPDSRYYKGMQRFERRVLLANIKNDRSVAFFTSYITQYSPFDQLDTINVRYLDDLPSGRVGKHTVWPKMVDLYQSKKVANPSERSRNAQEATSVIRSNRVLRYLVLFTAASILIPLYIPVILCISYYVSAYSVLKVKVTKSPHVESHWELVKESVYRGGVIDADHAKQGEERRKQRRHLARHESFKGDTSNFTESAMENVLYAEQKYVNGDADVIEENEHEGEDSNTGESDKETPSGSPELEKHSVDNTAAFSTENSSDEKTESVPTPTKSALSKLVDIKLSDNDAAMKVHLEKLERKDHNYPLFKDEVKLPTTEDQDTIIENLNKLDWTKIAVYHDLFNAHDGIVARRGARTNPKGTCSIYLWASILRNHLHDAEEKNLAKEKNLARELKLAN